MPSPSTMSLPQPRRPDAFRTSHRSAAMVTTTETAAKLAVVALHSSASTGGQWKPLVAALHDTSVAMIEKHYSHWIVDGLEEMAAAAVVPLVPPAGGAKVTRIRGA